MRTVVEHDTGARTRIYAIANPQGHPVSICSFLEVNPDLLDALKFNEFTLLRAEGRLLSSEKVRTYHHTAGTTVQVISPLFKEDRVQMTGVEDALDKTEKAFACVLRTRGYRIGDMKYDF
ncbi:hypothetical protein HYZ97_01590 [Candidatus Pacearchaeota archaeon]|nr:hypothetical protein [Candidatus Pacearchaeota archaeon]